MSEDGPIDPTLAVYEARAADWARERGAVHPERAAALAARALAGPIVDLGCGPGWHLPRLGPHAVALDGARAMLDLVPDHAPVARVQARLDALPFGRGTAGRSVGVQVLRPPAPARGPARPVRPAPGPGASGPPPT